MAPVVRFRGFKIERPQIDCIKCFAVLAVEGNAYEALTRRVLPLISSSMVPFEKSMPVIQATP